MESQANAGGDFMTTLDSVIVGGGQAGLGVSYFLKQNGYKHAVFEQGQIGESWLSKRWDSFQVNTPNYMNALPGLPYDGPEADGFWGTDELVNYFQQYVHHFQLPVRTGVTVLSVDRAENEEGFIIKTVTEDQTEGPIVSRSVVVASGIQRVPKTPALQSKLPQDITQLHTADYRNPGTLPPGAVVVVGSGQSGCQITEDLLSAGRTVYLCTSQVGRGRRRYRGRDLVDWWVDMKFWDVTYDSLEDKSISRMAQPQISGIGRYGHTVSLQHLAGRGAVILGRLLDVQSGRMVLGDDAAEHVHFADEFSQRLKDDIDAYLTRMNITPQALEDDAADDPDPEAECVSPLRELNLSESNVSAVIWATGFTGDFSWLHLPVFDEQNQPIHKRGISRERGLYFVGFPWLNSRKSGIIYGIKEDARYIADVIRKQLA
jgi:putative flavoprotein involved in K+ transport